MPIADMGDCPKCGTVLTNDDVSSDYDKDGNIVHMLLCSKENCDYCKILSVDTNS